jgi:hypothetical protein
MDKPEGKWWEDYDEVCGCVSVWWRDAFFDRYYPAAESAESLMKKNVSSLGPMKTNMNKDHQFDIESLKAWNSSERHTVERARVA